MQIAPELETFKENDETRALLIHTANVAWGTLDEALSNKLALNMQKGITAFI